MRVTYNYRRCRNKRNHRRSREGGNPGAGRGALETHKKPRKHTKHHRESAHMSKSPKKIIYLANPYGFSEEQKAILLPRIAAALESLGLEVWEPFERNNQVDFSDPGWAYQIGQADFRDVRDSDAISSP